MKIKIILINFLIKFIFFICILYGIVRNNILFYKDIFFQKYLKNIEIKNDEFERKNLTSKYVRKIKTKIKNKIKYFSNINSCHKASANNITESNLTKIIDCLENLSIYNITEQNIKSFNYVKNPKISIIIPIYNSQAYILQILKTIEAQSLKDIEILFVDDCSLDNTTTTIEKFQKKDKRIILLKNKQNKGPFYSRNKAGLFAKGEYIQFVDSDDILINNILEKAFLIAKKNDIDIIQYKFVKKKNKYSVSDEATSFNIITQPELSDQMYYGKGKLKQDNYYIFNKIIRRTTFLDALIFFGDDLLKIKLYMNEDLIQLFSVLRVANSLLFINDIGYLKIEDMNYNSLFNSHKSPEAANRIFHDNVMEIRFLFNKSQDNEKDKSIILDFMKMSKKNFGSITKYITIGFDFFEETFNLILNSSFYDEKQKSKIKKYKNNLLINRNYTIKG